MAGKSKEVDTGEINYVAHQRFWADVFNTELKAQRETPKKYGFLVDMYKDMNTQSDKGKPLPTKALRVKKEDFERFEPDPNLQQPVPETLTKHYGWNVGPGANRLETLDQLTKRPPRVSIQQQLNWPWGSWE